MTLPERLRALCDHVGRLEMERDFHARKEAELAAQLELAKAEARLVNKLVAETPTPVAAPEPETETT